MNPMEKIQAIFKEFNMNPEQMVILEEYFGSLHDKIATKYQEEIAGLNSKLETQVSESLMYSPANTQKAHDAVIADCETAYNRVVDECADKTESIVEELESQYADELTRAIEGSYNVIKERVITDLKSSKEFAILESIKTLMQPLMVGTEQTNLIEENAELRSKLEVVNEENVDNRKEIQVSTLLIDVPDEMKDTVKAFIMEGVDEDDVASRFITISDVIDNKLNMIGEDKNTVPAEGGKKYSKKPDVVIQENEDTLFDNLPADPVINSNTENYSEENTETTDKPQETEDVYAKSLRWATMASQSIGG